jgi:hypothetical protein
MTDKHDERPVMLSLISEQAIPNVMAALLVEPHPRTIVCILPEDRDRAGEPDREFKRVYEGIRAAFGTLAEDTQGTPAPVDLRIQDRGPVSPYDFSAVETLCRQIRQEAKAEGQTVVYNVTGGTKLMAQAALKDAQAGNCRAIYIDTEFRRLVEVNPAPEKSKFSEERLRPLDVPHYLAAYGLGQKVRGRQNIPEHFKKAAGQLVLYPQPGTSIVQRILTKRGQKGEDYRLPLAGFTTEERDVLAQVVDCLGSGASILGDTLKLDVDDDMYDFWWNRRWLEWYVFDVLETLSHSTDSLCYNRPWCDVQFVWETDYAHMVMDQLLFVEDEAGQRIPLPLNELDVAAIRGGRLLACECKTGKNALDSAHFYKLSVVGRRLGTFADKAFVTDVPGLADSTCRDANVRRQAVRALTLDTVVVGLEQLSRLDDVLSDPDAYLRRQKHQFGLR